MRARGGLRVVSSDAPSAGHDRGGGAPGRLAGPEEAMDWLSGRLDLERAPGARRGVPTLERTRRLLRLLGDPQDDYPVISVTGTNGKTSTTRMLAALLEGFGLSVGAHTSPHLERVNERLARAGEAISDHDLVEVLGSVALAEDQMRVEDGSAEARPSYFEVLTAAAYRWFADVAVQAAVAEVGLGGRWDATNVADAAMAVVTNVEVDHVEYLGPSRASIAAEKAGIVKPGCILVLGETDPELTGLFLAASPSRVLLRGRDFGVTRSHPVPEGRVVDLFTPVASYPGLRLSLHGAFQADNAALALAAAEAFLGHRELDRATVRRVFAGVRTPGRVELVERRPLLLLDGAHNPAGASALAATLEEEFDVGSRTLVVGFLDGRDPEVMLRALGLDPADRLVCCRPPSPRALAPALVALAARRLGLADERVEVVSEVAEAIGRARSLTPPDGVVVITGSLYLAGAARSVLKGTGGEPVDRAHREGPV